MNREASKKGTLAALTYMLLRITILLSAVMMFFPAINPARVCGLISKNMSLFTSGLFYSNLVAECGRAFMKGWVDPSAFMIIFISSLTTLLGIGTAVACGCLSVGNLKCKQLGNRLGVLGGVLQLAGLGGIYIGYLNVAQTTNLEKVGPVFPSGFVFFLVVAALTLITSLIVLLLTEKPEKDAKFEMESKFKLFLMFLPFAALIFVFSYLPLWGWRYAFFDYTSGSELNKDNFVGLKWFVSLFQNDATKRDIVRVLRNTLAMSGLGIATSWVAMAFAIFLSEIKNLRFRRFVQTFTTIPNFISWVLVYAVALAIFSTDGFINSFLASAGMTGDSVNYLMGDSHTWLKMLAWGMWKGLGWSAIIYIAAISGIDQQLYEAATVDGAGRFQKMRHVTLPGLVPTYCVLLLMAVAGVLSNGMDQYMVFENATNTSTITVLDLYVYQLGIKSGVIPLSTLIGMVKSIVSVALLFAANNISKVIRGESIV